MNGNTKQREFNLLFIIYIVFAATSSIIKSIVSVISAMTFGGEPLLMWLVFVGTLVNAYAALYLILKKQKMSGVYLFFAMNVVAVLLSLGASEREFQYMLLVNFAQIVGFSLLLALRKNDKSGWKLLYEKSLADKDKSNKKNIVDEVKPLVKEKEVKYLLDDRAKIRLANDKVYVDVAVVGKKVDNHHSYEYRAFDMKHPKEDVKLIGVDDGDVFAMAFDSDCERDYAVAIYLDGVNVGQRLGVHSLNSISEHKRNEYKEHLAKFIIRSKTDECSYIDRYSQASEKNRLFTFTSKEFAGINENLIDDQSLMSRIEVYVWVDEPVLPRQYDVETERILFRDTEAQKVFYESKAPNIKIGAGEETHKKYYKAEHLKNPVFLGKATFVYFHKSKLIHLGENLISKGYIEFQIDDPMDLIPKS